MVLEALHTARYLTRPQLQALFWRAGKGGVWGAQKSCERRLRKLTAAGLIRRIEQPVRRAEPSKPYIYALDRQGAEVLMAELDLDAQDVEWRPKDAEANYPFLAHLLATTDIRIAVQQACERQQFVLDEWVDEKELKRTGAQDAVTLVGPDGVRQRAAVVPDAYFVIRDDTNGNRRARFFLEVDRRSVVVAPSLFERRGWTRKIRAYLAYFDSDAYDARFEGRRVRVLTITTGEKRLQNLKQATERVGGGAFFWFTTFEDATAGQILTGRIWQVAGAEGRRCLLE
jgi:hypothetical protein